jgi:hypothetical protein
MINSQSTIDHLRFILLNEWDPIGVADEPTAQDEYDAYAGTLLKLILAGASTDALADYLIGVERGRMGLAGDRERARRVATVLVALKAKRKLRPLRQLR